MMHQYFTYLKSGIAPWALSRNKDTYGDDADLFRPERWLDEKRAREYERYDAFFGAGTWMCLGKLVSLNTTC